MSARTVGSVSLLHEEATIEKSLAVLEMALRPAGKSCTVPMAGYHAQRSLQAKTTVCDVQESRLALSS